MAEQKMTQTNGSLVPARQAAGEVLRQEFGVEQVERRGETASVAIAAREKAAVEARYIVAMRNPRDVDNFRVRLLKECRRSGFAETAEYERPVGREKDEETGEWKQKIARGPSIRLIETATQHFGNLDAVAPIIFESDEFRIVQARMTDLETNTSWSQDIIVPKRIEKRGFGKGNKVEPPKGREVISQRINSGGDTTFLVAATDAEVNQLQTSMISKAQRKNGERLLPSDIIHEAVEACRRTLAAIDSEDPDGAKRKIIDNFANLNIMPKDLVEYLGKPIDRLQPSELKQLRGLFVAITNGELSWEEALKARDAVGSREEQQAAASDKLNALRGKGSSTRQTATDAKAEGNTTAPAQSDAATGEPEASPTSTAAPSAPETPRHILDLRAWRDTLGGVEFAEVLKAFGFDAINEVPVEAFAEIQEGLNARAAALKKDKPAPSAPAPATGKKLKFGDPK